MISRLTCTKETFCACESHPTPLNPLKTKEEGVSELLPGNSMAHLTLSQQKLWSYHIRTVPGPFPAIDIW